MNKHELAHSTGHESRCNRQDQTVEMYPGPFSVGPRKIRGADCEDGKRRTATCSPLGADTFFSIPARVSANGRTVSGYVTRNDDDRWEFRTYRYGKNARAILSLAQMLDYWHREASREDAERDHQR